MLMWGLGGMSVGFYFDFIKFNISLVKSTFRTRPPALVAVWYLVYESFVIFEKQFLLQSTEKCWLFVVKNFPSRLTLYQHYIKGNIFLSFLWPIHVVLRSDHWNKDV